MSTLKRARLLGAVTAAILAVPVAGPAAAAPTAQAFSTLPSISNPLLSPNGKKIAARVARDGEYQLMILPIEGGGSAAAVSPGDVDILSVSWVNDDWLVVETGSTQKIGAYGDHYITRAIAISADGQKVTPLLSKLNGVGLSGGDVVWTAKDGSPRILLALSRSLFFDEQSFYPEVQEINLATGDHKVVAASQNGIFNWYADADGVVRYGTGRTGVGSSKPRIIYRERNGELFRDVETSDSKPAPAPLLFKADGRAVAITDDDQGFSTIYELDLGSMKLGKAMYAANGYDIDGIVKTRDGKSLAGVVRAEAKPFIEWVDPAMAKLQADVSAKFGKQDTYIVSTSRDGSRAIVLADAPDSPGGYYVYDRATDGLNRIAQINSALGIARLNPVKTVRYKARDGLEIEAVVTTPKGKTGPLPVIVMPHGGPYARDFVEWDWWTQFMASKGYVIIQPNYRGSSGYGTAFTDKGEGQWGLKMQDDLDDALAYLAKEGIGDPKRACMVGASYGGYAAMRASERGQHYRCTVSYAGVSDLGRLARENSDELFGRRKVKWLRNQAPDFRAVSPLNNPTAFSIPLLLVHGVKDQRVAVSHSRDMAKKLQAAGKDVTYIEQPLADHHFSRSEDRLQFLQALEAFLAKHNPA